MTLNGIKPSSFTMNLSHDRIHHLDGMNQVALCQLVLYPYFALCGLHCLPMILRLTCLVARIGLEYLEGCTLSGGALDQIRAQDLFYHECQS